jgi:hypothetical protein
MADKKISQLTALSAANLAPSTDVLAVVDTSATETKKIVAQDLVNGVLNVASAVGIGTSSPISKLHSTGPITQQGAISTGAANATILANSSGQAQFWATGPDASTRGSWNLVIARSDLTSSVEVLKCDTSGNLIASGNLGLGVTPSAWGLGKAFEVGNAGNCVWGVQASDLRLGANMRYDGTNYKYINTNFAARYDVNSGGTGGHSWLTAPSWNGTGSDVVSFTQALTLDANVNLLLNGTSAPASGVGTFAIFNGTAPTGSVTNGIVLYAEDVSSSSELKVRDEAGNVTTLSPHNFSLIPEGASEDMAWAYYSEKCGKRINVDMLKLARIVEKLTGEKLVYEA